MAKPKSKVLRQHGARELVLAGAVAAARGVDDVDQHLGIEARLDAHRHDLGGRHQRRRGQEVVGQLGRLGEARSVAGMEEPAECLQDRLDLRQGLPGARHHDRKRAGPGAGDAAAHRGIDPADLTFREPGRDLGGHAGPGGREIDQGAHARAVDDAAIAAQRHLAHHVGRRQADQHDLGGRGDLGRRGGELGAARHQRPRWPLPTGRRCTADSPRRAGGTAIGPPMRPTPTKPSSRSAMVVPPACFLGIATIL